MFVAFSDFKKRGVFMRLLKIIFAAFTFIFVCNSINAFAQQTNLPKQIRILHNYGSIPFEDGKTKIAEVRFIGFDTNYEQYDETTGKKIPESDFLKFLRESKANINVDDKFSGAKVAKAVKVIKDGLSSFGYLNAEVIAYGEELPKNQMNLIFSVKRGNPAFVSEIRFDGNVNVSSAELVENFKECLGDRKLFDARVYEYFADKCSRRFLFSKGYFQAKIHSITPRLVSNSYVVEISIDEGIRFVYGTIKFEGTKVFSEKQLLEMFGQKSGDVSDGKYLQNFIYEKLQKEYANKGYVNYNADFDVTFIEPQSEGLDGIVNLVVDIDEELQYQIGKIEFVGIDEDDARKLKEIISLNVGEVYNQSKFEEGIKKINELKDFKPIDYQRDVEMRVPQIISGGLIIGENPKLKYRDENIPKETPSLDLLILTRKLTEDERTYYKELFERRD